MNKSLKTFVALCAIAVCSICATLNLNANKSNNDLGSNTSGSRSITVGSCQGEGKCGVTRGGTILIGKWTEMTVVVN